VKEELRRLKLFKNIKCSKQGVIEANFGLFCMSAIYLEITNELGEKIGLLFTLGYDESGGVRGINELGRLAQNNFDAN
jgi:hypothetical protein